MTTSEAYEFLEQIKREERLVSEPEPETVEKRAPGLGAFHRREQRFCGVRAKDTSKARLGELSMKEWVRQEARRQSKRPISIYHQLRDGKFPGIKLRRVNKRTVFVRGDEAIASLTDRPL